MTDAIRQRWQQLWINDFGLSPGEAAHPGTTLVVREDRDDNSWLTPWPVGERVVIDVAPALRDVVQAVIDAHPPDYRLRVADLVAAWGTSKVKTGGMKLYLLDWATFKVFRPSPHYTVRGLTVDDRAEFNAFLHRCPKADSEEADVSLDQENPHGVIDENGRIVAACSAYVWRGLVDLGVLTDPEHRGQGLAKAVVSGACLALEHDPRLIVYRHGTENLGSQGVARGLHFAYMATIESVRLL